METLDTLFWTAFSFMALVLGARAVMPIIAPDTWITRQLKARLRFGEDGEQQDPDNRPG